LGPSGTVTFSASTKSNNYPTTVGAFDRTYNGGSDVVVTRLVPQLSDPVPPGPPISLTGTVVEGSAELRWELPAEEGDFPMADLRLYRGTSSDDLAIVDQIPPHYENWTDAGLELGSSHHYAVKAYSYAGESAFSNVINLTYTMPPSIPQDLQAEPGCGTVQLNWSGPNCTGGCSLLGYTLYKGTSIEVLEELANLGLVEGYLDEDVVNGQEYFYSLRAVNERTAGDMTQVVSARPTGPPTAPRDVVATAADGSVTLTWTSPENDGGYEVRLYVVLSGTSPDIMDEERMASGHVTRWVDSPLENGVTRWYTVLAETEMGRGPPSSMANATPMGLPGMPRNVSVVVGNREVSVSWEPPEDDGGAPIEGYHLLRGVSTRDLLPLAELGAGETSYTDTGLENGVTLYYAVLAWNVVGDGSMTKIVEGTPRTLPGPPTYLSVEEGIGVVTLDWSPPENVAATEVIQYVVYRGISEDRLHLLLTVDGRSRSYEDREVVAGFTYHYSVSAVTGIGEGPQTTPVSATPYGPPGAPMALVATAGDGEVVLSWEPPENDGASPVIGYTVLRGTLPDLLTDLETVGMVSSYIDPMVTNGVIYHYALNAINDAGPGDRSGTVEATPTRPPDTRPPGKVSTLVGMVTGDGVVLQWEGPNGAGSPPVTGYLVLRGEAPDNLSIVATLGPVGTWTDTMVTPGRTYHYCVLALNGEVEGEPADVIAVEVPEPVTPGSSWTTSSTLFALAILVVFSLVVLFIIRNNRRGSE
jgi:titin